MEKLLNLIMEICNWYENTTVRRDDPFEIADIKKSERGLVRTSIYAIGIVFFIFIVDTKITQMNSSAVSMVMAPLLSQVATVLSWALIGAMGAFIYYLIRYIYLYRSIGRYD